MTFANFKTAVARQFERMKGHELFRADVEKDALWETYLGSFPPGTNQLFRTRTEFDCSCCRAFIRNVGDLLTVIDGRVVSIWDIQIPGEPAFQAVADGLAALVREKPIDNVFLHTEKTAGTDKSRELLGEEIRTWDHFFVNIPPKFVCKGTDIGPKTSETRALHDVLYRSLTEITDEAVDTVLELIAQNSLYRGQEHQFAVLTFKLLKEEFKRLELRQASDRDKHAFVWSKITGTTGSVAKIRNTSIGTLLVDLSSGTELEDSVRKFEAMVAPANYKRPTALVTKKQVENAKKTIQELGLESALERRYAKLSDISINDILFADRSTRRALGADVFDSLTTRGADPKTLDKVEEVPLEKFLTDILPRAEGLEVMIENKHSGNLVSLIAPEDPTAGQMFKWDNRFSWSYNGDVADSIKERVKQAGGSVSGDLLCRLGWSNYDDLDLYMTEPNGNVISYRNKMSTTTGGRLDVDMNAGGGSPGHGTRTPVENIFYADRKRMREGQYTLFVNQFSQVEKIDGGFEVEFDYLGTSQTFVYEKSLKTRENIVVVVFRYTHENGVEIISSLPSTTRSKTMWNVQTNEFHRVNVVMNSPNYWGDHGVGNKHLFLMLDECRNDGTARGFYNEFLKSELDPHRKVIEMVGAKMRTDESNEQLSGLGFSSTQRAEVLVRVKGAFTRVVRVMI